ncbi:MAG: zinc-ribbon domain-containing protein, partial [Peptoniphilus sp.]
MFCPHCGSKNPDDADFCGHCGKLLHNDRFDDEETVGRDDVNRGTRRRKETSFGGEDDPFHDGDGAYGSTSRGDFVREHAAAIVIGAIAVILLLIVIMFSVKSKPEKEERVNVTPHVASDRAEQVEGEKVDDAEDASAPSPEVKYVAKKKEASAAPVREVQTVETVEAQSTREAIEREGLVPIHVPEVYAESWLDEGKFKHGPENLVDGDPKTAWCSARGDSSTNVFELYLQETRDVRGIAIDGGYQKSEDLYYQNARPRTMRVT